MTRLLIVIFGVATLAAVPYGYTDGPVVALGLLTVAAAVVHAGEHVAGRLTLWTDDALHEPSLAAALYAPAQIRRTLEATLRDIEAYVAAQAPGSQMLAPARHRLRGALDTLPD